MKHTTTQTFLLPKVSHDLRNYIGGISSLANIIVENLSQIKKNYETANYNRKEKIDLDETLEIANMLVPYANEAFHYIEDMLDINQIRTGKFNLGQIEECDVADIIHRMLVFNNTFIIEQQVRIETNIEAGLPKLKTDVRRLKQILTNLILNAAKYSPSGNKIIISAKFIEHKIHIEIADCGIGMNEAEIIMALNGDGQEIDKSLLNKPINSHGIGMTIVKQLVELLEGELIIQSQKGKGTKIVVSFYAVDYEKSQFTN